MVVIKHRLASPNLDLRAVHKKELEISYKNQRGFHSCPKNEHKPAQ